MVFAPASRDCARRRWTLTQSGVVSPASLSAPGRPKPMVPRYAPLRPTASAACASRYAVVVLPFVPVMPTTSSSADGSRKNRSAIAPTRRESPGTACTTTFAGSCGASRPGAGSQSTATAPLSTAAAACCTPCDVRPWQAMNTLPGVACRLSCVRSDTSTSRSGRSASPSSAASDERYAGAPPDPDTSLTSADESRLTMDPGPARGSSPARAAGRPAVSRAGAARPTSPRRTPGRRLRRRNTRHRWARR